MDGSSFLKLVNIWWTINNSKQEFNTNFRIGNATVKNDKKPLFLREFGNWLEDYQRLQSKNCIASLIEDRLMEKKYKYVLTSRFQTDCLKLRFSKYSQMSGGRFLFGLREMQVSERILSTMSLLKVSINIWNEDISPDANDESMWSEFEHNLEQLESDIDS